MKIAYVTSHMIKNVKRQHCIYFLVLLPFFILTTTAYGMSSQAESSNPCIFPSAADYSSSLILPSTTNIPLQHNVVLPVQNNSASFIAPMQANRVLSVYLSLHLRNQEQLHNCVSSINDPTSPNYRHFLNNTTILPYVPTSGQKLSIISYLTQHGFTVTNSSLPLVITASAPVSTIESTFGIKINIYQVPVKHKEINTENTERMHSYNFTGIFYASDSSPQLPSNIANLVGYIGGLNNYTIVIPVETPCDVYHSYCPQGIQAGYLFSNLFSKGLDGSGLNVAIVDFPGDPDPQTAINTYDTEYNLSPTTLNIYYPDGQPSSYNSDFAVETMMDIEAVHTAAPAATIDLIYPTNSFGIDYVATHHIASIVSNSWGFACSSGPCADTQLESSLVSSFDERLSLDAANGLTILFASGDQGGTPDGTNLGTEFPASDPNVLAVGATNLILKNCVSTTCSGYQSETAGAISGGGYSGYFAEPDWQTTALGTTSGRGVPDVSMLGDFPGVWAYSTTFGWFQGASGTSLATPLWAGYLAVVEQAEGGGALGNISPILYEIYKSPSYSSSFHDIVTGTNMLNGKGYSSGVGWDPVTGLGTPVADSLLPSIIKAIPPPRANICDLRPNPCYEKAIVPWYFIISPILPPQEIIATLPIVVYLDQAAYDHNSVITIHGIVNPAYLDQDIALKIIDPTGNVVSAEKIPVDNSGKFSINLNTTSTLMSKNGVYTIYAQQGDQQGHSYQIQFVLASTVPEFGSMMGIIMALSVICVITISRKLKFISF